MEAAGEFLGVQEWRTPNAEWRKTKEPNNVHCVHCNSSEMRSKCLPLISHQASGHLEPFWKKTFDEGLSLSAFGPCGGLWGSSVVFTIYLLSDNRQNCLKQVHKGHNRWVRDPCWMSLSQSGCKMCQELHALFTAIEPACSIAISYHMVWGDKAPILLKGEKTLNLVHLHCTGLEHEMSFVNHKMYRADKVVYDVHVITSSKVRRNDGVNANPS